MKFDILHNFISPVTGRILSDYNYVLVGNRNGVAIPSPILIDIRLDFINLKKRYNTLVETDFIIGHANKEIPNAQILENLDNGFMITTDGVVSTSNIIPITALPDLTYKNIWIGDITNRPVEQQRVTLDNLPSFTTVNPLYNFGVYNLYTGQGIGASNPLNIAQPTTTLQIDMSNLPNLEEGFLWLGQQVLPIPPVTIDAIPPFIHGEFNWGLNRPVAIKVLPLDNMANLTSTKIWRGDITNRPVESDDLTLLEDRVSAVESDIIVIEGEITALQGEVIAITADVAIINATLYTPVVGLVSLVGGLIISVGALQIEVSGIQLTLLAGSFISQTPILGVGGQALSSLAPGGILQCNSSGVVSIATIVGTTDEITVTNGNGVGGSPTVAISDNPILPGTASVTIPIGTTAERPVSPTVGMIRYNTTINQYEVYL